MALSQPAVGTILNRCVSFFLLLLAATSGCAESPAFSGRVTTVKDGDSFLMQTETRAVHVRLAGIDAPEWQQPGGTRARQALTRLIRGAEVTVTPLNTDRYGRIVAYVHVGRTHIGHEMVRNGYAWIYHRYNRDPALEDLEQEARAARRGIWALPEKARIPPWVWRQQQRR